MSDNTPSPQAEKDAIYVVSDSEHERQRLQEQGESLKPFTVQLFNSSGIREGMHILDVGSGAGDVAFAAAEIVGSTGSVVGVDSNPAVLETARERAAAYGYNNITFQAGDIRTIKLDTSFDAAVGRAVLMYHRSPVETIRNILPWLTDGGIVAFLELDSSSGFISVPPSAYHQQLAKWMRNTVERAGMEAQMGLKLHQVYIDAGLPAPQMQYNAIVGGGPDWPGYKLYENLFRSILPAAEKLNVVTAAEVEVDKIAERLREETVSQNAVVMASAWVGAWTKKGG